MASRTPTAQGADRGRPVTGGRLVVVGGGEHARVVAEAALAAGWSVIGYTDAAATPAAGPLAAGAPHGESHPIPCLGTDTAAAARFTADVDAPSLVLGFGGPVAARRDAAATYGDAARWAIVVHPTAAVSPSATLGPGAVVLAGAVVGPGAAVGAHAIVNTRAVAEHDVVLGDHAHLAPGATVGGGTTIGAGAFVGLGAAVRDHVRIGEGATVGMGAVVVADVAPGVTVIGIPARVRDAERREPGDG